MKSLWEILVPTKRNDGRPIHTRFHRVWDKKIRDISGGLTLLPVVKGQWLSGSVLYHNERMIPVRIIATREEIEKIIDLTLEYYEQEAVLAYRVADEVILKNKGDKHLKYFAIYSTLIEDVTGTVTCAANTPDPLVERGERLISITEEEYNGVSFDYPSGFAPEVLKKILKRGKI